MHLAALTDVEQRLAIDEKAHFEFVMGVLAQEFLAQRLLLGVVRLQADDVDGLEAVLVHQAVDRGAVGLDHLVLGGMRIQRMARLPAFELHADLFQMAADILEIGVRGDRLGGLLVNTQFTHVLYLPLHNSHSSMNSSASTRCRACATLSPQA